jgi:hypothetical protein
VTITSEEYHDIRHLLKLRLRGDEEGKDLTYPGIQWADLRNWYLSEVRATLCLISLLFLAVCAVAKGMFW